MTSLNKIMNEIKELKKNKYAKKEFGKSEKWRVLDNPPHGNNENRLVWYEGTSTVFYWGDDEEKQNQAKQRLREIMDTPGWICKRYAAGRLLNENQDYLESRLINWIYGLDLEMNQVYKNNPQATKSGRKETKKDLKKLYSMRGIPSKNLDQIAQSLGYSRIRRAFRFLEADILDYFSDYLRQKRDGRIEYWSALERQRHRDFLEKNRAEHAQYLKERREDERREEEMLENTKHCGRVESMREKKKRRILNIVRGRVEAMREKR